jgi:acetate kinase
MIGMRILVLNCGSSSFKFQVVEVTPVGAGDQPGPVFSVLRGHVKNLGREANLTIERESAAPVTAKRPVATHEEALIWALDQLHGLEIHAVGHRVVHGGERYCDPVRIDSTVLAELDRLSALAPLHNPAGIAGIRGAQACFGLAIPMAAVFDTAFHRTMPAYASTYALPQDLAEKHAIRRYGFHGIAHASLVAGYERVSGRPASTARLITVQLGNGCSAAAVKEGITVDTSMGFTPLEGLVMGTRSGDLDPAVVGYLAAREQIPVAEVEEWLNERSGLLGLSGLSADMKELIAARRNHHPGARLAIEVFCHRVRKYLGAYLVVLGGADAVLFGGGIGEHASEIRAQICGQMEWCGLRLDPDRNRAVLGLPLGEVARISSDDAGIAVYVAAVDEEVEIARQTFLCLRRQGGSMT